MIVDFHTHLFPPDVGADRDAYLREDRTFRELYGAPEAKLATAEDLLASMDAAAIDVSVALGFAWGDASTCRRHNDYLLESARRGGGRILAFCTLPLAAGYAAIEAEARRCVAGGAKGFGELRPDNLGFEMWGEDARFLGRLAHELGAVLLFHVSEPVGHAYPGKHGLEMASFYEFVREHPETRTVGAHWGGGLPFYSLMPEVRLALANAWVDTAATSLLYAPDIYRHVATQFGAEHVLFGSDYPLLSQKRSRARIEEQLTAPDLELVLGGNAARLLGLT